MIEVLVGLLLMLGMTFVCFFVGFVVFFIFLFLFFIFCFLKGERGETTERDREKM